MKKKIVRLTEYDLRRIVKKVINEEQNLEMEVDKLIDDSEIMNALETEEEIEEEIEIPEVILQLEKNPPRWYIRLKQKIIRLKKKNEMRRRKNIGGKSYKERERNKKIGRTILGAVVPLETIIIALFYKLNSGFRNLVDDVRRGRLRIPNN